jgi:hypothetical protein
MTPQFRQLADCVAPRLNVLRVANALQSRIIL